jgi:hypothetical protein
MPTRSDAKSEPSRINDVTVPYVTGAIELDDPFLNYASLHMKVFVPFIFFTLLCRFLTLLNSQRL